MDALFDALAKLLAVFKDPTQVVLLFVCISEGYGIYRLVRFMLDRADKDLEARVKLATALEGLTGIIKEKIGAKDS